MSVYVSSLLRVCVPFAISRYHYALSYRVHRQTARQTHRHTDRHTDNDEYSIVAV